MLVGEGLAGHTSIALWNYPLMMAWKLAPALAGGNTMVFKPSEHTPLTTLKMARILADILLPGVVNIVLARGRSVGSQLVNHLGVDMISLTGDIGTGTKMLEAAASRALAAVRSLIKAWRAVSIPLRLCRVSLFGWSDFNSRRDPILPSIPASVAWQAMLASLRRNPIRFGQRTGYFGEAARLTRVDPCERKRYLDEFVFRWNRRRHMRGAFDTLLGIGIALQPATYRDFVELNRPGFTGDL